jgi:hypothetical protein
MTNLWSTFGPWAVISLLLPICLGLGACSEDETPSKQPSEIQDSAATSGQLHQTALKRDQAQCLSWVKTGKAPCEHMFSGLPLKADVAQRGRHVRFVPITDISPGWYSRQNAFGAAV